MTIKSMLKSISGCYWTLL